MSDDVLDFAAEDDGGSVQPAPLKPWRILIVDDEEGIHTVTKMALSDLEVDGRKLEFLHAYSGAEAKALLAEHGDIAMCLLDVVMETDHAGLDVARWVRTEHRNQTIRIVLRTGQPGQAPERRVITEFDINGYKEKAELTATRLFSTVYSMICAYRDLRALQHAREALGKIILLSHQLSDLSSVQDLADAALQQLGALLNFDPVLCIMVMGHDCDDLRAIAATDERLRPGMTRQELPAELATEMCRMVESEGARGCMLAPSGAILVAAKTKQGLNIVMRAQTGVRLSDEDQDLMQLYCESMALAIEKIQLKQSV